MRIRQPAFKLSTCSPNIRNIHGTKPSPIIPIIRYHRWTLHTTMGINHYWYTLDDHRWIKQYRRGGMFRRSLTGGWDPSPQSSPPHSICQSPRLKNATKTISNLSNQFWRQTWRLEALNCKLYKSVNKVFG